MIDYSNYCEAEKLLRIFFENKEKIKLKEAYLKKLEKSLKAVTNSLVNTSIVLNTDLKGINYDRINIKGGQLPCGDVDRQIENIFSKLEREKGDIENEIILTNTEILMLNNENRAMESIINLVSDDNREFIKLRYESKLSFDKISIICHMSKSTLRRKSEDVLNDITKFMCYLQIGENDGSK